MRPLAEAACELPWLAPCAGSLVALTGQPGSSLWSTLRSDPGLVLLLLRQSNPPGSIQDLCYSSLLHDSDVLKLALDCLAQPNQAFVDWQQPTMLPIYQSALACANAAEAIAVETDRCDADHAWVGGLLSTLGWLAAATVRCPPCDVRLQKPEKFVDLVWPVQDIEQMPAIGRRLSARWQLPLWISAIVGHLGLPVDAASALGADPDHFLVVQLGVAIAEQAGLGLNLALGARAEELARALDLTPAEVQTILANLKEVARSLVPPSDWEAPASVPMLPDLLRLALENRRSAYFAERERLHADIDALHNAVERQHAGQSERLQDLKLRALAELAAGAGHEINNPLAVISGQAQYLLVGEQEPGRRKALQTIVGQTQRIHQTLTQLMQFARPPAPQKQRVDLGGLVSEVVGSLQGLADERQVRLACADPPAALTLLVDPTQIRTAIVALLRNAIEAAPASGWASLRVDRDPQNGLVVTVEDNGAGPSTADREHLFDPFYSGRKAGRGRGLGLPTAWQLTRQHSGDICFDAAASGVTRFVLTLPVEAIADAASPLPRRDGDGDCLPLVQSA